MTKETLTPTLASTMGTSNATTHDSPHTVSRSSNFFLLGTLMSRFCGLGREILFAFVWGASAPLAALMVAFRFASLFRRVFGEGVMSSGFIPLFEKIRQNSALEGARFYRDMLAFTTIALTTLGVLAGLTLWIAPKFLYIGPETMEIATEMMLMVPGVICVSLFGLTTSLLNCERRTFISGSAPALFNLCLIIGIISLRNFPIETAMLALAGVVSLAFFCQVSVTAPETWRYLKQHLTPREIFLELPKVSRVASAFRPYVLGLLGVSAIQINTAFDAIFARVASGSGPAFLWYAVRIEQLPLALFVLALTVAILPPLSRAVEKQDWSSFKNLTQFGMGRGFAAIFPSSIGLVLFGDRFVNLIYGHGHFTQSDVLATHNCLIAYAIGLVPTFFSLLFSQVYYSQKRFKIPALVSGVSVIINLGLNAFFVFYLRMGPESVAWATTVAVFFNAVCLIFLSSQEMRASFDRPMLIRMSKVFTLTVGACLIGLASVHVLDDRFSLPRSIPLQLISFFVPAIASGISYILLGKLFSSEDILNLLRVKKTHEAK